MCMVHANLYPLKRWNWDGDQIVHSPAIPRTRRTLVGKNYYDVDIREFLSIKDNAVIKGKFAAIVGKLPAAEQAFIQSRAEGAFDFRVQKVLEWVSDEIAYAPSPGRTLDFWQFPEETVADRKGDCEDRAFLLAAMMLASGVSSYVVRVALGKLYDHTSRESMDHVWVMYKNEAGVWMLLESLIFEKKSRSLSARTLQKVVASQPRIEYIPYFVFNDEHLWRIENNTIDIGFPEYLAGRNFWSHFNPKFAAGMHNTIFDQALAAMPWAKRQWVKAMSLYIDSLKSYDPRDHFDNGYIGDGWMRVQERLGTKRLNDFAFATHAVADLYAHTSYACFAKKEAGGQLALFDGNVRRQLFTFQPDFGAGIFDLHDAARFTINKELCKTSDRGRIIADLNPRLIISGRFAQPDDPLNTALVKMFINIPRFLRERGDFEWRGGLPHHDEIAVDRPLETGGAIPAKHKLYADPRQYREQFELRQSAAIRHIESILTSWYSSDKNVPR